MTGMRRILLQWAITAVALAVCVRLIGGIHIRSDATLLVSALVLGLVNAVVRPILVILTLPATVLTLGLFYLLVNGAAFGIAALLVPGFTVASTGSAVLGALVVSVVSWLASWLLGLRDDPDRPPAR
jgi:putative membrane protein